MCRSCFASPDDFKLFLSTPCRRIHRLADRSGRRSAGGGCGRRWHRLGHPFTRPLGAPAAPPASDAGEGDGKCRRRGQTQRPRRPAGRPSETRSSRRHRRLIRTIGFMSSAASTTSTQPAPVSHRLPVIERRLAQEAMAWLGPAWESGPHQQLGTRLNSPRRPTLPRPRRPRSMRLNEEDRRMRELQNRITGEIQADAPLLDLWRHGGGSFTDLDMLDYTWRPDPTPTLELVDDAWTHVDAKVILVEGKLQRARRGFEVAVAQAIFRHMWCETRRQRDVPPAPTPAAHGPTATLAPGRLASSRAPGSRALSSYWWFAGGLLVVASQ